MTLRERCDIRGKVTTTGVNILVLVSLRIEPLGLGRPSRCSPRLRSIHGREVGSPTPGLEQISAAQLTVSAPTTPMSHQASTGTAPGSVTPLGWLPDDVSRDVRSWSNPVPFRGGATGPPGCVHRSVRGRASRFHRGDGPPPALDSTPPRGRPTTAVVGAVLGPL